MPVHFFKKNLFFYIILLLSQLTLV